MPDTATTTPPFLPVKPKISIGTTGSAVDIACSASDMTIEPAQDEVTWETFCGSGVTYKPEVWTVTVTVYQSYGVTGLWNLLRPLVNTVQPFSILPDGTKVAGPGNPQMTGTCIVKGFPYYSGGVGEPTTFDVELAVQGAPVFALALAAVAEAEAAAEKAAAEARADAEGDTPTGKAK